MHPLAWSHVSTVQALWSLQSTGLQAKVVVVVVLVVEVLVAMTTATRSSTQSSTRLCNASELFVGCWQSFGSFASSFAKQPLVDSVPPLYLVFALSMQAL